MLAECTTPPHFFLRVDSIEHRTHGLGTVAFSASSDEQLHRSAYGRPVVVHVIDMEPEEYQRQLCFGAGRQLGDDEGTAADIKALPPVPCGFLLNRDGSGAQVDGFTFSLATVTAAVSTLAMVVARHDVAQPAVTRAQAGDGVTMASGPVHRVSELAIEPT